MALDELLNISINETLSRTILTGVTTPAVLGSLLAFGGDVLRNFSFAKLLGVVIGTYFSIFLAAPLLGYLGIRRDQVRVEEKSKGIANRHTYRQHLSRCGLVDTNAPAHAHDWCGYG